MQGVDVRQHQGGALARPHAALGHQPDDGLITAVGEPGALTGGDQVAQLGLGQRVGHLDGQLRRGHAQQPVGVDLALGGQPMRVAAQRQVASADGGGLRAAVEQGGQKLLHRRLGKLRGGAGALGPAQELWRTPSRYWAMVCRDLFSERSATSHDDASSANKFGVSATVSYLTQGPHTRPP